MNMSKKTFIAILSIFFVFPVFSQNLKLEELLLFQKKDLGYIDDYLSRKGWELHSTSIDNDDYLVSNYNLIIWSYKKNKWNGEAEAWLKLYEYDSEKIEEIINKNK